MVNFKEHIEEKNVVTGKEDFRQLSVFIANSKENPFLLKEYLKENGFLEESFSNLLLKINSKKRNNERMDKIEFLSKKYAIEFVKGETVNYEDLSSEDKKIVNKVSLGIVLTDMVGLAGFMSIKDMSNIRHEAFTKYEVTAGNKNKEKEDSVLWYNAQSSFLKKC